jgi:hypothetical protein
MKPTAHPAAGHAKAGEKQGVGGVRPET